MIFTQFVDDALGCASYLVGDEGLGEAVVVDPAYAIEQYLEEAKRRGVRLVRVVETHTHADHVSGHGRLALEHGLPVSIHPAAGAEYPHDPLEDGDELELGDVVLRCLHTPGHRPEHCCLAVIDRSRAPDPGSCLPATRSSSATRPDPIWRSMRGRAPRGSTARSSACSSSTTASRCIRVTSQGRSAARR